MHFGILVFPGTNCEHDTLHVVQNVLGETGELVWHTATDVSRFDALVLPGGFAHGDYLRTGAVARFSPVMDAVAEFAAAGKPVLGICNGFQILCEAGLLPGALRRNNGSHFICKDVYLRVENNSNLFLQRTNVGDLLRMPIRHGEGSYYASDETLAELEANGQVLLRYANEDGSINAASNPNGSSQNIAGVCNERGNVFGLMPHPEAASEAILGNADGLTIFLGILTALDPTRARTSDSGLLNATPVAAV
jgi:phosphoribosylformylglycinamidine synthase I